MGSSVGATVGVNTGVSVATGNAVAVDVDVGIKVGALVEKSISGSGATCATGVQALLHKTTMKKRSAMCFKDIPPSDEVNCCFNGNLY